MLKIAGKQEFAKWWKRWLAKINRTAITDQHPPSATTNPAEARPLDGDHKNP